MWSCPICYEAGNDIDQVALTRSCEHEFCRSCIISWLREHESASFAGSRHRRGRGSVPTCPECRETIQTDDIVRILGRPLEEPKPRVPPLQDDDSDEAVDELTLAWLEDAGAKRCPGCRIWIIRYRGCADMMCRCGQTFCWHCGKPRCFGTFFNNVLRCEYQQTIEDEDPPDDWPEVLASLFNADSEDDGDDTPSLAEENQTTEEDDDHERQRDCQSASSPPREEEVVDWCSCSCACRAEDIETERADEEGNESEDSEGIDFGDVTELFDLSGGDY